MSRNNAGSGPPPRQGSLNASVRFELPDLFVAELIGDLDASDTARLAADARRAAATRAWTLMLCDISRIGSLTSEARRVMADGFRSIPLRGIAFYGGNPRHRAQSTLMANAMNLLNDRRDECPFKFFPNEAEARLWLGLRREELKRVRR